MASANIAFDGIPSSIRKPGKYFEFNTRLAVRTLPGNPQRLLCLAQKLASGSQPALVPVDVFSDEQAAQLFGRGSYAHRMARAAITANPYLQLTMLAVEDAPGSVAAVGGVLLAGTATSSGQIQVAVGNNSVSLGISAGMLASDIAIQLTALLNALDLPVLGSPPCRCPRPACRLTCRHKSPVPAIRWSSPPGTRARRATPFRYPPGAVPAVLPTWSTPWPAVP